MPALAYLGLDVAQDSARVCFLLADDTGGELSFVG